MKEPILKRRHPLFAAFLSLSMLGLGQVYCGRLKRGILLFLCESLLILAYGMIRGFHSFSGLIIGFTIILLYTLYVCTDAFLLARRVKTLTLKPYNKWYLYIGIYLLTHGYGFIQATT